MFNTRDHVGAQFLVLLAVCHCTDFLEVCDTAMLYVCCHLHVNMTVILNRKKMISMIIARVNNRVSNVP